MVRNAIRGIGRTMIAIGVLMLLFVAYQLWGTNIAYGRGQRDLRHRVEASLAQSGVDVAALESLIDDSSNDPATIDPANGDPATIDPIGPPTTGVLGLEPPDTSVTPSPTTKAPLTTRPAVPATFQPRTKMLRRPRAGDELGLLRIPKIGVKVAFGEGTAVSDLKYGPGHYSGTPLPGEPGNAAIAGHRTTYGAPFYRLNELQRGDPIYIADGLGVFKYVVESFSIVSPKDSKVLNDYPGRNTLTLTTCHPRFSASKRLVVVAELVGTAVEAELIDEPVTTVAPTTVPPTAPPTTEPGVRLPGGPGATVVGTSPTIVPPVTAAATAAPTTAGRNPAGDLPGGEGEALTLDGRREGGDIIKLGPWFAGPIEVWSHTFAWASICGLFWLGTRMISRKRRDPFVRFGVYVIGFVPFLVPLYFCYENLARLLPENV